MRQEKYIAARKALTNGLQVIGIILLTEGWIELEQRLRITHLRTKGRQYQAKCLIDGRWRSVCDVEIGDGDHPEISRRNSSVGISS